jgi:hypothetical protein
MYVTVRDYYIQSVFWMSCLTGKLTTRSGRSDVTGSNSSVTCMHARCAARTVVGARRRTDAVRISVESLRR